MPSLSDTLTITRTARVTALDRAGVEVACAIRPLGHVLQVSNGKGLTWADARASAISEAAELWACEQPPRELVLASSEDLTRDGRAHLLCERQSLIPQGALRELRLGFVPARDLFDGTPTLVPAGAVHCLPPGAPYIGPLVHRWTSNGLGAHPTRDAALLHALLEVLERHGLAHALPMGFSPATVRTRIVDMSTNAFPRAAPQTHALVQRLAKHDLHAHLFDLRPTGFGLPLAGAILLDDPLAPIPLTAGYACALRRDDALHKALLEAAQSRLTDIHGAREDVATESKESQHELAHAVRTTRPRRQFTELPDLKFRSVKQAIALVLHELRALGVTRAAAVDLAPPGLPLSIVKVLIPSFDVSELL